MVDWNKYSTAYYKRTYEAPNPFKFCADLAREMLEARDLKQQARFDRAFSDFIDTVLKKRVT